MFSISESAVALVLTVVLTATAVAQQASQFAATQQANQAALRQYTWKSRTELKLKSDIKQVRLEQVRFDLDGRVQKTPIGGGAADDGSRAGGPLKKRIVEKKKGEVRELVEGLASLAESYSRLSPEQTNAFAGGAVVSKGEGIDAGSMRLLGRDVLTRGDRMAVFVDPTGFGVRRIEIDTFHEERPVSIQSDFRRLPNGPSYQARSTLRYPSESIEVTVETFDYAKATPH